MTLMDFLDRYADQQACLGDLERVRWQKGRVCPKCGVVDQSLPLARRGYFHCQACRNQFTVLHGTPFEGTHLPLRTWFSAIYLTGTSNKGVSASQRCCLCHALHREMRNLKVREMVCVCGNVIGRGRNTAVNIYDWHPEERENRDRKVATRIEMGNQELAPVPVNEVRILAYGKQ
jgi:hypothetical protein